MNHTPFTSSHISTKSSYDDAIKHNAKSMQKDNIPWESFIDPSMWWKSCKLVTRILADLPRKAWIDNFNKERQKKAKSAMNQAIQNINIQQILANISKK